MALCETKTQIILWSCQLFSEGLSRFPVCLSPFMREKVAVAVGLVGKQRDWLK